VPFFGPSTVRDLLGKAADALLQPLAQVESGRIRIGAQALGMVQGPGATATPDALREQAPDDYLLVGDPWGQRCNFQIGQDQADNQSLPDYLKQ
jgi:ABC-type transporter lipoprotein component MlaA